MTEDERMLEVDRLARLGRLVEAVWMIERRDEPTDSLRMYKAGAEIVGRLVAHIIEEGGTVGDVAVLLSALRVELVTAEVLPDRLPALTVEWLNKSKRNTLN